MIKALIPTANGPVVLIGLSRKNCEKLLDGQPIKPFSLRELGLDRDIMITVVAGETEEAIQQELDEAMARRNRST